MICTFKLLLEGNQALSSRLTIASCLPILPIVIPPAKNIHGNQERTQRKSGDVYLQKKAQFSAQCFAIQSPPITRQIHNYQDILTQKDTHYINLISCSKLQRRLLINYSSIYSTKQSVFHRWQGSNFISISISNQISHLHTRKSFHKQPNLRCAQNQVLTALKIMSNCIPSVILI